MLDEPVSKLEPLDLPKNVQPLLSSLRNELNDFFAFDAFVLGGGTTLAARWNHRRSFDIDLLTTQRNVTETLFSRSSELNAFVEAHPGMTELTCERDGGNIAFANDSSIDWLHSDHLTRQPRSNQVDSNTHIALSSTPEILALKVYHRTVTHHTFFPADLYDIAWAITHDPPDTMLSVQNVLKDYERDFFLGALAAANPPISPPGCNFPTQ